MYKQFLTIIIFAIAIGLNGCVQKKMVTGQSWSFQPFVRPVSYPVISPDSNTTFLDPISGKVIRWEANDTFNPAATVKGDSIYVIYRVEDKSGLGIGERTSRLGLVASADGLAMNRRSQPILYPANDSQKENEWMGGCEDPRVVMATDGTYVMMYTQWNKKVPRLAVATSKDLENWDKHGPVFNQAYGGKFADLASKSASVVTTVENGKQVIAKINGKFYMYWGEEFINLATSDDLINWTPELDESGDLKKIILPRKGYFDSQLTECGPPAVLADNGIVLLYNGKNLEGKDGDPNYTAKTYAAGQLLFDAKKPGKLLNRLDKPFFVPTESFEKSGQYPSGTVFVEGLVYFTDKWFLYYGCADSKVGVAVYDPPKIK
ncbi:glycoside hydrolase family 130 protein [Pedobacter arcticus]|uniref:glycoside hydrolase family 130 protein n=1 Tax=Pedobacter arcticus TaxID=752140 RepID=UPI000315AB65|nr:glycoside hydrolase family 130 protein [Pedobacter arcticus]